MDEGLKKRLIGATVLVSLVVIFVPMLLQREPVLEPEIHDSNILPRPDRDFRSRVIPSESEQLALPPREIVSIQAGERPPSMQRQKPSSPASSPVAGQTGRAGSKPSPAVVEPRVGLSAWIIQVGSFSKRENAEKLVTRLRGKSFSADIEQASVKGRTMYRVLVGPEIDRKRAETMLARLNREVKALKLKGKLKSYP